MGLIKEQMMEEQEKERNFKMEEAEHEQLNKESVEEHESKPSAGDEPTKEDMFLGFANLDLKGIKKWAENISGYWNGDDSGRAEDRAGQANDIIEAVDNLVELLQGMEEL